MPIVDVEILLRVPEGEELSDERLELLMEMGLPEEALMISRSGRLLITIQTAQDGWEREAESRAEEILEEMPDADLVDIALSSEADD